MKKVIYLFLSALALVMLADSCKHDAETPVIPDNGLTLQLHWSQAYSAETKTNAETGLKWCLSYLGAMMPKGSFEKTVEWKTPDIIQLNLAAAGFSNQAQNALSRLVATAKNSDEYQKVGSIDLGRFVALTIGSSKHYYAITRASETYQDFRNRYTFDTKKVALTQSTVSKAHRLIEVTNTTSALAFIASEGAGHIDSGTFAPAEYETIDVLPNGQLRVAIYNLQDEELLDASDSMLTSGGKPAKCLWCHELYFNPSFATNPVDVNGYYTVQEFQNMVNNRMNLLWQYRDQLNGDIDFSLKQDHAQMELLYISFMEPSAERLAMEWRMPVQKVKTLMAGLSTHVYTEFPFLGQLYYRKDADQRAPFKGIPVPESIREKSVYEPNLLK